MSTYRGVRPIGTATDSRVPMSLRVDAARVTLEKGCLGVEERDRSARATKTREAFWQINL